MLSWSYLDLGPSSLVGLSQGLVVMTLVFVPSHTMWIATSPGESMKMMIMDDDDDDDKDTSQ